MNAEIQQQHDLMQKASGEVNHNRLNDALEYIRERQLPGSTYRTMVFTVFHEVSRIKAALTAAQDETERLKGERDEVMEEVKKHRQNASDWSTANHRQIKVIQDQRTRLVLAGEMAKVLKAVRPMTIGHRRAADYADTHRYETFATDLTNKIDSALQKWEAKD